MYVNIVLFDDFETLDAFGPAEVFGKLPEEFHIRYLSVSGDVINSVHGVKVWTDFLVPEEIDGILIIPGGKGARRLLWKDERALNIIKKAAENSDYCLMIGNGSAILAQTGLLYRRRIADFPMDTNWNRMFTAGIERIEGAKVAIDGKFYSCGYTILGMDTALWTITDVLDIAAAEKVAKELGYPWNENADEDIYC